MLEVSLDNQLSMFRAASIPAYGLPSDWIGTRSLGESEIVTGHETTIRDDQRRVTEHYSLTLQLVHGDRRLAGQPYIAVGSSTGGGSPDLVRLFRDVSTEEWNITEPCEWVAQVAGRAVRLSGRKAGQCYVGSVAIADHFVMIACRDCTQWDTPPVLDVIHDLSPYIQGRREQLGLA